MGKSLLILCTLLCLGCASRKTQKTEVSSLNKEVFTSEQKESINLNSSTKEVVKLETIDTGTEHEEIISYEPLDVTKEAYIIDSTGKKTVLHNVTYKVVKVTKHNNTAVTENKEVSKKELVMKISESELNKKTTSKLTASEKNTQRKMSFPLWFWFIPSGAILFGVVVVYFRTKKKMKKVIGDNSLT